jgi:hypothetical protein
MLTTAKHDINISMSNQTTFQGFLPNTIGQTAGFPSVQISTSADRPHPPPLPLPATLIGSAEVSVVVPGGAVIVEAGGQTVVVE